MLLTLRELLDLLVMTIGVGFIFMSVFKVPRVLSFDFKGFLWACLITAPALIFHELAHKFTAIAFGAQATFHAAYSFLALGVVLKLINSPFIFFVPGYVEIPASLPPMQTALVALAGPALNGVLWLIARIVVRYVPLSNRGRIVWTLMRRLNGFLFIFNLLPIPGFDGFTVFKGFFGF
jgi:Zn-dependent protease